MSTFEKLSVTFKTNWTTILVGWTGLGVFGPWPERWSEFPPLISAEEIVAYANARITHASSIEEGDLIDQILAHNLRTGTREETRDQLKRLSEVFGGDPALDLRKWRLVLLEELLANLPQDALYGLISLSEFWQSFGFPPDGPHEVQGRGNAISPSEYYQQPNLDRLLTRHLSWIQCEKAAINETQRAHI